MDARAALADVQAGRINEANAIASLGGAGVKNTRRDFNRLVAAMKYGIEVYNVELLLREPLTDERSMQLLPILLPHELVAAVFRYGWSTFSKVFFNGLPEGRQSNSVLIVGFAFQKQHQIFLGSRGPGAPECRVQDPPLIKIWCQCLVATLS